MIKGNTAIITGASRGIGKQLVKSFLAEGANVVACARSLDKLEELKSEFQDAPLEIQAADATKPEDVRAVVERTKDVFGRVEILVNNAGAAGPTVAVEDLVLEDWVQTINSNLTSTFLFIRECVPAMKLNGAGAVVNIGSMTGKKALVFRSPYAAAKMALIGLTRTVAEELGPHGIRVNTVCPGAVEGERLNEVIVRQAEQRGVSIEDITAMARGMSPLKSFVSAKDVAELVLFLASDKAGKMTGQDINISAGQITW